MKALLLNNQIVEVAKIEKNVKAIAIYKDGEKGLEHPILNLISLEGVSVIIEGDRFIYGNGKFL